MPLRTSRSLRILVSATVLWVGLSAGTIHAADASLLPDDSVLTVRISSIESLLEIPLVQEIWETLQDSPTLQESLETVESQNLQQAARLVEHQLDRPFQEVVFALTSGGIELAVGIDRQPQVLLILNGRDAETVDRVVQLAVTLAEGGGQQISEGTHRGVTGYRLGNAAIAAVESHLLVGSHPDLLKAAVDRHLDGDAATSNLGSRDEFEVRAVLDLARLRTLSEVSEGLKVPAADGGLVALLGGWIDLLRRHERVSFDVSLGADRIDALVRFSGADSASPPEFAGFWADSEDEFTAPLLRPPGTIYSTSWYRDYGALWAAREQLVTARVVQQMEEGDAEAAAQFETLGSAVSLSEVVSAFGPRLRVVVAEQTAPPYEFELRNRLPAAALVVELKNEDTFRQMAEPLARVIHLILSFEQKFTTQKLDHEGAVLQQISQPHTERDIVRRDRVAYNFRPTYTITRGHLIVGTTPDIVRQVIDALDAQNREGRNALQPGQTSRQFVNIDAMAAALDCLRDAIIRRTVLDTGVSVDHAERDLDVLLEILRLFNTKQVDGAFTPEGFEHRVTVTAGAHTESVSTHVKTVDTDTVRVLSP